ncbi:hypothetical protein MLD38_004582 [Melastoma candidum]|uniref:Uncharacterized protein n=1 Tax=Melastoma candidum TaxID=119954 RepID=A0ACB9S684_9MYRT|nr:hypothetical protein MLD38_004582 [Melastoma candidum]
MSKPPSSLFWLTLHVLSCLISLLLGFRFSRLLFFLLFSSSSPSPTTSSSPRFHPLAESVSLSLSPSLPAPSAVNHTVPRVVVGRHGIRIRPWPHPDPTEVMRAHAIIERVQREQREQFGPREPRTIIAVTPTYVRTFQAMHLTGVMHALMGAPYEVVWVVVEAGGKTNETAGLLERSGLKRVLHVGFDERMPDTWEDRGRVEARMRFRALRVIRDQKLDGVVMFLDDSNINSMELFDEVQNVKWIGAISVGILTLSNKAEESRLSVVQKEEDEEKNQPIPVQGPACNSSNKLVGWHTFNMLPYEEKRAVYIDDKGIVLPRKLEWAGFVLNSRLLWKDVENRPVWMKDLDSLVEGDVESPLSLLEDQFMVEPLGGCGRKVMLWWLRIEAHSDSKFPPGWVIDPPLDITVPAKRTPWPDAPPELPSVKKVEVAEENPIKPRTKRSRRGSRKRRQRAADTDNSVKQAEQN